MAELTFQHHSPSLLPADELLEPGEVIAVVEDSPNIVFLHCHYLHSQGFNVVCAGSAEELFQLLASEKIALILLDIGLPGKNGNEILKDIIPAHPDTSVIMVTGTTDIEVALDCLRQGADDYLTKPVKMQQLNYTVKNSLKNRRLAINSGRYQEELQKTNTRMSFLHHLNLKMNTAYLNTGELRGILQAILVGITSNDGLKFNRAFLALYNDNNSFLEGKMAIGPGSREEAGQVWEQVKAKDLQLDDILEAIQENRIGEDITANRTIQSLKISTNDHSHVLNHSSRIKMPRHVKDGHAEQCTVPQEFLDTLGVSTFVVVPLYSPEKSLGVIIVDNFVTTTPITRQDIQGLEIFASQASLAIEHSHLYTAMATKIEELELVTQELEKNKNLLIETERASAIGHMSAQLLHSIRNPLTSIGGTSRLLTKKITDPDIIDFLDIITSESNKIETTLADLFSFVEDNELSIDAHPIFSIIRKSVMIYYTAMKNQGIDYTLDFEGSGPELLIDDIKIHQVLLNLIRNSIEAMPNGGSLHVSARDHGDVVSISITDSGPGILPETLPHVKAPFFTTKTYGNGLGLALADQVVKAHDGEFDIQTAIEGGSIAKVTLPKKH